MRTPHIAAGILLIVMAGAVTESPAQAPGTVVLSLEEFDVLRARAAAEAPQYALSRADYAARVDGGLLRVHAEISVVVLTLEQDFVFVPLLKQNIVIDQASTDAGAAVLAVNPGGVIAVVPSTGLGDTITLTVDFHTEVREEKGFFAAEFEIPPAGVAQLTVDFPFEETKVFLNERYVEPSADAAGHSILRASIGSANRIALRWLPLSSEMRSIVTVDETLIIQHHADHVECLAAMELRVAQRPLEQIAIAVEEPWDVLFARGDLVGGYEPTAEGIVVRFREPVLGATRVEAVLTQGYGDDPSREFRVPHVIPAEARTVRGVVAFALSDWYRVRIERTEGLQPGTAESLPDEELRRKAAQVFHFRGSEWALIYRLERIEPEFTAAVYNRVTFGETTCVLAAEFECLVQQGAYQFFEISDVPGFRLESVQGPSVRDWVLGSEGGPVKILLNRPERGKVAFSAAFRKTYEGGETMPVGFPEVLGARRIRGFVTVQPQASVRVTATDPRNLEAMDPSEVPLSMQTAEGGGARYAFRYLSQPASLSLVVERFEEVALEESVVERMLTRLTYSIQGSVRSESTIELLNADLDLVPFRIGEGATIRNVMVGEASVAPAEGEATGTVLIPAPKSKVKPTRISLVYLMTGESLERRREAALPIPRVPLPIDHVLLQVIPPKGYEVELVSDQVFQRVEPPRPEGLPAPETRMYWMTGPGGEGSIPTKAAEQEMKKIAVALETYYVDHNSYPPALENLMGQIAYLKADRSVLGRYVYETDGLSGWKLGIELPYQPDEAVGQKTMEGVHFEAKLLRDEPGGKTLDEMLEVKVRLSRKRRGWF